MSVSIGSTPQFNKLLSSSTVVVADFYADWCGPCKQIGPVYEKLAAQYSKPGRVTFTKVNVDSQKGIASQYGVRAMPTFKIFKNGTVVTTIQGADANGLTSAIQNAIRNVGPPKPVLYASAGRTLGGPPRASLTRPRNFRGILETIIAFFGIYFISLFSFDSYGAVQNSSFNKTGPPPEPKEEKGVDKRTGAATQVGKKLGTIADLGGD